MVLSESLNANGVVEVFPRACLPECPFPVAAAVACSGELKRHPAQLGGASFERGQMLQGPHGGLSPQNGVL